jgi:hypothetical protein
MEASKTVQRRSSVLRVCLLINVVLLSVYNSNSNVMLCLHSNEKLQESTLDGYLRVYDVNPSIAAIVIGVNDPILLTINP